MPEREKASRKEVEKEVKNIVKNFANSLQIKLTVSIGDFKKQLFQELMKVMENHYILV